MLCPVCGVNVGDVLKLCESCAKTTAARNPQPKPTPPNQPQAEPNPAIVEKEPAIPKVEKIELAPEVWNLSDRYTIEFFDNALLFISTPLGAGMCLLLALLILLLTVVILAVILG